MPNPQSAHSQSRIFFATLSSSARGKPISRPTGLTVKNNLRRAQKILKDHIDRNPMDKVDRPKKAKYTAAYFTREEATALLELAKGELLCIPILLGIYYGLRSSETIGLQSRYALTIRRTS